jgi:hypothetical protein
VAGIAPIFTSQLVQSETFNDLLDAQIAVTNNPTVNYATVSYGSSTFSSASEGTTTSTYVSAEIFLTENTVDDVELARQLGEILVVNFPESLNRNVMQINLIYGYDIGIFSQWSSHAHSFNPNEL